MKQFLMNYRAFSKHSKSIFDRCRIFQKFGNMVTIWNKTQQLLGSNRQLMLWATYTFIVWMLLRLIVHEELPKSNQKFFKKVIWRSTCQFFLTPFQSHCDCFETLYEQSGESLKISKLGEKLSRSSGYVLSSYFSFLSLCTCVYAFDCSCKRIYLHNGISNGEQFGCCQMQNFQLTTERMIYSTF